MDTFTALADPTRRTILELLVANDSLTTTEIFENFQLTQPAISQHLKVLRTTDLVHMEKRAQSHYYSINHDKLLEVQQWLERMTKKWNNRFDRLEKVLQTQIQISNERDSCKK